jgi:hypothetical protein
MITIFYIMASIALIVSVVSILESSDAFKVAVEFAASVTKIKRELSICDNDLVSLERISRDCDIVFGSIIRNELKTEIKKHFDRMGFKLKDYNKNELGLLNLALAEYVIDQQSVKSRKKTK